MRALAILCLLALSDAVIFEATSLQPVDDEWSITRGSKWLICSTAGYWRCYCETGRMAKYEALGGEFGPEWKYDFPHIGCNPKQMQDFSAEFAKEKERVAYETKATQGRAEAKAKYDAMVAQKEAERVALLAQKEAERAALLAQKEAERVALLAQKERERVAEETLRRQELERRQAQIAQQAALAKQKRETEENKRIELWNAISAYNTAGNKADGFSQGHLFKAVTRKHCIGIEPFCELMDVAAGSKTQESEDRTTMSRLYSRFDTNTDGRMSLLEFQLMVHTLQKERWDGRWFADAHSPDAHSPGVHSSDAHSSGVHSSDKPLMLMG